MFTAAILQEFDNEAKTTRRVLERVPTDKLGWKPHPKSMSLGELAMHVARIPGVISTWCEEGETDFAGRKPPVPASTEEILATHDADALVRRVELSAQLKADPLREQIVVIDEHQICFALSITRSVRIQTRVVVALTVS